MKSTDISIVVPVYNEEDSILSLYKELTNNIDNSMKQEYIFVNDGSTDNSEKIINDLMSDDQRIVQITLNKNYGKAIALQAGFNYSNGDIVVTIDDDLQDDPSEISRMITEIHTGWDIVSGRKKNRI